VARVSIIYAEASQSVKKAQALHRILSALNTMLALMYDKAILSHYPLLRKFNVLIEV
jgi:hypothetical protein